MTNNNPLLGQLLSAHKLGDYRRTGLIGCGVFLLVPLVCGVWSSVASLTYAREQSNSTEGFYFSLALVAGSLVLFALLGLVFYLAPRWMKRAGLEIYQNGFVIKRVLLQPQTCLWSEIREVNPMLLITSGAHRTLSPGEFYEAGEEQGKFKGIYEVYKNDGSKIGVSRRYEKIELIDEVLIPFCPETPVWGKEEEANQI